MRRIKSQSKLRNLLALLDKLRYIDYYQYIMRFMASCADCFAGLSDKTRVGIVNLLLEKDKMSVLEIGKHFKLTQPTITHHLHYLKEAGVLESSKKGRKVFYFISPKCKKGRCKLFV